MKYIGLIFLMLVIVLDMQSQILPSSRSTDWSAAGLNDTSTIGFAKYDLSNYPVIDDGITPNDSVIDQIIQNHTGNGAILYFPSGDFLFNSTLNLPSDFILKGDGPESTTLLFDLGGSGHSINIAGNINLMDTGFLTQNGFKDSSYILLDDASFLQTGDWIHIIQNDTDLVTSSWAHNTVGQIVQIKSIVNNKLELESALRLNCNLLRSPFILKIEAVQNIGIECLKIKRLDDAAPQHTSNIRFSYAVNCWVNGIESENCTFSHIAAERSSNLHITDSYFHHAFSYGSGGRAYGVMLHYTTGECLVENSIFEHLRHAMILQAGANGNVFAYNYSFDPYWDVLPNSASGDMVLHGNYPFLNLFEQNICQNIVIDDSHGPNGPFNTLFRNRAEAFGIFFSASNSPMQNIVGNEITNNTFPYNQVNYTILGSGHFVYGNNNKGTIDPVGTDSLPDISYYSTVPPSYVPIPQWGGIGAPFAPGTNQIPPYTRYQSGNLFAGICGNSIGIKTPDQIQNGLLVYPNPANTQVNIHSSNQLSLIKVYDSCGKLVFLSENPLNDIKIDVSDWRSGLYVLFYHSQCNNYPETMNLIIQ